MATEMKVVEVDGVRVDASADVSDDLIKKHVAMVRSEAGGDLDADEKDEDSGAISDQWTDLVNLFGE